jgi:hypothetical protein
LLLVAATAAIALISSGRLDPRLPGPLQARLGPQTVEVGAEEATLSWQTVALPEPPYSIRLLATSSGAETVAYGLAVGDTASYLAVAVSPAGTTSVTAHGEGRPEENLLWHSAPGAALPGVVELQVDVREGEVTVWVERQVLWEGAWDGAGRQVGLLARGEGGAATVVFESVELFGP